MSEKADLLRYLQTARDAMLWKLEGLSEYDVRRPMTRTGTNLLGLVKHLAAVELGYFGEVFDRPTSIPNPWSGEDNADMWATADESRKDVVGLYRSAWAHTDATVEELDLNAAGRVPWWGDGGKEVTLRLVLLHVVAETHRHAGHADVVRELVDGAAGYRADNDNLPPMAEQEWEWYRDRLEQVARQVSPRG